MATFLGNRQRDTQYSAAQFRTRPLPLRTDFDNDPSCIVMQRIDYHAYTVPFRSIGRPLSHPIFSDAGFERFKYVLISGISRKKNPSFWPNWSKWYSNRMHQLGHNLNEAFFEPPSVITQWNVFLPTGKIIFQEQERFIQVNRLTLCLSKSCSRCQE